MQLFIDDREREFIKALSDSDKSKVTVAHLDVGDFIIGTSIDEAQFVIERKTIADLNSSIKDGRYREQKSRLMQHFDATKVMYLIEATSDMLIGRTDSCVNAICNTLSRDGIRVFRTTSLEESKAFLLSLLSSCEKLSAGKLSKTSTEEALIKSNKVTRKKVYSDDTVYVMQLCCLPGVSAQTAKAIASVYPRHELLIRALVDTQNPHLLSDVCIGKRKLGKRLSEKVFKCYTVDSNAEGKTINAEEPA